MSSFTKSTFASILTTLLCLTVVALPHAALAYSAAGDFSATSNPNGVWSYGWSSTLGSAFNLDSSNTSSYSGGSGSGWLGNLDSRTDGIPFVLHNGTANPITYANSVWQPGQLVLQSGAANEYAIVRWTAPFSGTFSIAATFSGLSSLGDSSDVHILLNGVSLFDSNVIGSPSPESYSGLQNLTKGDTIDFVSGSGVDGSPNEGYTALSASIVPEPTTVALVGAGLSLLFSLGFLKRK